MRAALVALTIVIVAAILSPFGVVRTLAAVAMGLGILYVGIRYVQSMLNAPPDPELADVSEYELRYVCTMCGLELKVEVAAKDRAPSHCMEPMVLVQTGGKPPLRPV